MKVNQLTDKKEYTTNPESGKFSMIIITLLIAVFMLLSQTDFIKESYKYPFNNKDPLPVKAYEFALKHDIPGNFYAKADWGSYAIFKLYPKYKVFIDTRFDMYGDKAFSEYHKISTTKGNWEKRLINKKVNWIVAPNGSGMASKLRHKSSLGWVKIYSDSDALIFIRELPENENWIKQNLKHR